MILLYLKRNKSQDAICRCWDLSSSRVLQHLQIAQKNLCDLRHLWMNGSNAERYNIADMNTITNNQEHDDQIFEQLHLKQGETLTGDKLSD